MEFEDKYNGAEAAVVCLLLSGGGGREGGRAAMEMVPFTAFCEKKKKVEFL